MQKVPRVCSPPWRVYLDDGLILRPSQEASRAAEFISLSDFPASVVGAGFDLVGAVAVRFGTAMC